MNQEEREAMLGALDALVYHTNQTRPIHETDQAITKLRDALAQPEQAEPSIPLAVHEFLADSHYYKDGKYILTAEVELTSGVTNVWSISLRENITPASKSLGSFDDTD